MTWSFGTLGIVALSGAVLVVALAYSDKLRAKLYPPQKFWPYHARKVLSAPQLLLYRRLVKALPECMVLAALPLAKVIAVKRTAYSENWMNRIAPKSLDFVVCRPDSSVLAAILLEGPSGDDPYSAQADRFTDNALAAAGIALLRWNAAELPSESQIRQLIALQPADARAQGRAAS